MKKPTKHKKENKKINMGDFSIHNITKDTPVIAWWSGGVSSAVTCKLCIDFFGLENVKIVFIDTKNESDDTYVFLSQCEAWYGKEIETISHSDFTNIREVWYKYKSLNVATGAICSTTLKRFVREVYQRNNKFSYQAFGFDIEEINRAKSLKMNHPDSKPIFPLIFELMRKKDCVKTIQDANNVFLTIEIPQAYKQGYHNNNCWKTMCVQGGIGYWQKVQREQPEKFDAMATVEHELTDMKGEPVTMLKDQSKSGGLVFLKPHPKYLSIKDISMMKGREPKPLMECNGFCGTNDLQRNETENEINYATNK
jgi:3'-phosphoadenosine 5'-phosphosulfate sulfotransferase (PAPS reductase)/FAD synthetase